MNDQSIDIKTNRKHPKSFLSIDEICTDNFAWPNCQWRVFEIYYLESTSAYHYKVSFIMNQMCILCLAFKHDISNFKPSSNQRKF